MNTIFLKIINFYNIHIENNKVYLLRSNAHERRIDEIYFEINT